MTLSGATAFLAMMAGTGLAIWVLVDRRDQRVRWAFALGMLALAVESFFSLLCLRAGSSIDLVQWEQWRILTLSTTFGPWLYFSLRFARGETASAVRRSRGVLFATALIPPLFAAIFFEDMVVSIRPPEFGFLPILGLGPPALAIHLASLLTCLAILMNLERTFRASIGTMRWRIKFMVLGLGATFVVRLVTSSHALLFQVFNPRLDNLNSVALLTASVLIGRSLLRSGQFHIELYPSQSVIRNSVTIILTGAYLVSAGLLAKFVGGSAQGINLPRAGITMLIAGVLLTIALMSDRLRLATIRFISRHFQRPLYDYRSIWRQFTEATSSPVDLGQLGRRITRASADVFQTQSVSLWIFDDHEKTFVQIASTAQPGEMAASVQPSADESEILHQFFSQNSEPLKYETKKEAWAGILKRCHPAEFTKGGNRVCAPLIHQGELVGMLLLGDRVGNEEFGAQDFDILKCIADHVTASLLNVQLSRQLLQSREMAAFQTMAAFFVHDLKNAVSTLNLMMPNLKTHWDTPGFREDALRGISKTVEHINGLVGRLTNLRSELTIAARPASLDDIVIEALSTLPVREGIVVEKQLDKVPVSLLDAEQLKKVFKNLVLNAYEAIPASGLVKVRTSHDGGWLSAEIADNGKGMAPEFVQKSLFRPFQTTKKGGLGIGMFHTRMIVEAHGGRIDVVSRAGSGTTIRVMLPLKNVPQS